MKPLTLSIAVYRCEDCQRRQFTGARDAVGYCLLCGGRTVRLPFDLALPSHPFPPQLEREANEAEADYYDQQAREEGHLIP